MCVQRPTVWSDAMTEVYAHSTAVLKKKVAAPLDHFEDTSGSTLCFRDQEDIIIICAQLCVYCEKACFVAYAL